MYSPTDNEHDSPQIESEGYHPHVIAKALVASVFQSLGLHVQPKRLSEDMNGEVWKSNGDLDDEEKEKEKEKEKKKEKEKETGIQNGSEKSNTDVHVKDEKDKKTNTNENDHKFASKSAPNLPQTVRSSAPTSSTSPTTTATSTSPNPLPDIAPELMGSVPTDSAPSDDASVAFHDCFLIFRALCKLSIKEVYFIFILFYFILFLE
jgi:hypothetical protein